MPSLFAKKMFVIYVISHRREIKLIYFMLQKLGGKVTTDTVPAEVAEAVESSSEEETTHENAVQNDDASSVSDD